MLKNENMRKFMGNTFTKGLEKLISKACSSNIVFDILTSCLTFGGIAGVMLDAYTDKSVDGMIKLPYDFSYKFQFKTK